MRVRCRFAAILPSFLLALSLNVAARVPASAGKELQAVRALAHRVKSAEQQVRRGESIRVSDPGSLAADLRRLRAAASNAQVEQKLRAIGVQLDQVNQLLSVEAPPLSGAHPDLSRANVDIEVVTPEHGGNCRNALGIRPDSTVRLTLGKAGSKTAEAWLRIETRAGEYAGFATDSNGPDPAIELFSDCAGTGHPLAANDDADGLDASAAANFGSTVYARISNTGDGGSVSIDAVTTLTAMSGLITDAESGNPIHNAFVAAHLGNLFYGGPFIYGTAYTNASGSYLILLPSGSGTQFYVRADASAHVAELYPDGPCPFDTNYFDIADCTVGPTSLVNVNVGEYVTGIDMALSGGRKISGTVTDKANQPLRASVAIVRANGSVVDSRQTDENGAYTFIALTPGAYELRSESGGYGSQLYDHLDCTGPQLDVCDYAAATSVNIDDQDASGTDFQLTKLASIVVSVTDGAQQPISAIVSLLNEYGTSVGQTFPTESGDYAASSLAPGTYYVAAEAAGYFSQLYPGLDCSATCGPLLGSATPIVITGPEQDVHVLLEMHKLPTVHGHVSDAATNDPLANVSVFASKLNYGNDFSATTDDSGNFALDGVVPGTYYLIAVSADHIDRIYPSIECQFPYSGSGFGLPSQCNPGGATLLTIEPGQTPADFNFALNRASQVSGHVSIRSGMPADLPANAYIRIDDQNGMYAGGAATDASGNYAVKDLAPGTYFALASGNYGTVTSQIWQSSDCDATCLPGTGTPIVVGPNSEVSDIDFSLLHHDVIVGRLTNTEDAPIAGAKVDLFSISSPILHASGISDDDGYYTVRGYTDAGFIVATDAGPAYVNQINAGIICAYPTSLYAGTCASTGASPVGLASWSTQSPIVNFVLSSSDPLFENGFEP